MKINLSPMRSDHTLELARTGDVLTVNGEDFDFGPLDEGATLPADAIDSEWIVGNVRRVDGQLVFGAIILPHGADAPHETRFPLPLIVTRDGPIPLPPHTLTEEEAPDAED